MSDRNSRLNRRNFLLTLGAGSAATAAAVVAAAKAGPGISRTADQATRSVTRGYRETAHIARYYRTAKV